MLKEISTEISARVPKINFNRFITIVVPQFVFVLKDNINTEMDARVPNMVFYLCSCHDYQLSLSFIFYLRQTFST